MNIDLISIIVILVLLTAIVFIFIRIAVRVRNSGGSLTTIVTGSTYEFLNRDKREAVSEIIEMNEGKKQEEQKTSKQNETH